MIGDSVEASAKERYEEIQQVENSSRGTVIGLVLLSAILGFGIALLISRSIQRSVADVLGRLTSLSDHCVAGLRAVSGRSRGDLTGRSSRDRPRPTARGRRDSATSHHGRRDRRRLVEAVFAIRESRAALAG